MCCMRRVGQLYMSRVSADDAGVYVCEVHSDDRTAILLTAETTLHVTSEFLLSAYMYTVSQTPDFWQLLRQILTTLLTSRLVSRFAVKSLLKIPPQSSMCRYTTHYMTSSGHQRALVTWFLKKKTLPCEILMSETSDNMKQVL